MVAFNNLPDFLFSRSNTFRSNLLLVNIGLNDTGVYVGGYMTLEQAIKANPFNPEQGNLAAYCRYLRYNVNGLYEKSNKYVQRLFIEYVFNEITKIKEIEMVFKESEDSSNDV